LLGQEVEREGLISPEEGGPSLIDAIYAPRFEKIKDPSDKRVRRSLAHEIVHALRALSNRNFWRDVQDEAELFGLRKPDSDEKKKHIGGFYVASNMQGAEAVGELLAAVSEHKAAYQSEPTIKIYYLNYLKDYKLLSINLKMRKDPKKLDI